MGAISLPSPCLLFVAVCSRHADALAWAREQCAGQFGEVALASEPFEFTETGYYRATMGEELRKQFLAFEPPIDPGQLAACKHWTNRCEAELTALGRYPETRPLNLDPGYLTLAKLVLASTKDHAHRIYLRDGIYAEVTLSYRRGTWQPFEWTYPDYRRSDYHEYFSACRARVRNWSRE